MRRIIVMEGLGDVTIVRVERGEIVSAFVADAAASAANAGLFPAGGVGRHCRWPVAAHDQVACCGLGIWSGSSAFTQLVSLPSWALQTHSR